MAADTRFVTDLAVARVLLMDDARWPWLILVPRRPALRELFELAAADRALLIEEIARAGRLLTDRGAHKINVGALGNLVPQLHVHVIAREPGDPAWPGPVWGCGTRIPYEPAAAARLAADLAAGLGT